MVSFNHCTAAREIVGQLQHSTKQYEPDRTRIILLLVVLFLSVPNLNEGDQDICGLNTVDFKQMFHVTVKKLENTPHNTI